MSVGTVDTQGTTYFVDSGSPSINVPAGVYEATSTASVTFGDAAGNSFAVTTEPASICAQDGLSQVFGSAPLSPLSWESSLFDSTLQGKTIAGIFPKADGYEGVTTDKGTFSSSNGKFFSYGADYNPTYDAPEVLWTASQDAQAIPGNQLTFPTSPALQEGDVVVVSVGSDASTPNLPSGWTSLEEVTNSDSYGRTIYKVMTATPDANVYIDGLSEASAFVAVAVRNVGSYDAGLKISASTSNNASGMPNAPSVTTTEPNSLVIAIGRLDDDSVASSVTAPAGYSNLVVEEAAGLTGQTVMAATKLVATAGTEDPAAFGGTGDDAGVGITVTLGPTPYFAEILDAQKVGDNYFATSPTGGILKSTDLSDWTAKPKTGSALAVPQYIYFNNHANASGQSTYTYTPYFGTSFKPGDVIFYVEAHYANYPSPSFSEGTWTEITYKSYSNAYIRSWYTVVPDTWDGAVNAQPITITSYSPYGRFAAHWYIYRNVDETTISSATSSHYSGNVNFPPITASGEQGHMAFYSTATANTNWNMDSGNSNIWGNMSRQTDSQYMSLDGIRYQSSTPLPPGVDIDAPDASTNNTDYTAVIGIAFSAPSGSGGYKFAYNNNTTLVGVKGVEYAYSTDNGESWTVISSPPSGSYTPTNSVVYSNGKFIVGINDDYVYTSSNGSSWAAKHLNDSGNSPVVRVSENNGVAYATLLNTNYYYSTDGFNTNTLKSMDTGGGAAVSGSDGTVQFIGNAQFAGDTPSEGNSYGMMTQTFGSNSPVQNGDLLIFSFTNNNSSIKYDSQARSEGWKLLAAHEIDSGYRSNSGLTLYSYYRFVDGGGVANITVDFYAQWAQDTSLQTQGVSGGTSANFAVFRNVDPTRDLMAVTRHANGYMFPAQLPNIPEAHMQLTVGHAQQQWSTDPSSFGTGWEGYENNDTTNDNYGAVAQATKWFPSGGAGANEMWRNSSNNYAFSGNFATLTVAMFPVPASAVDNSGEEPAASVASVYATRSDGTIAIGSGGAVLSVTSGGAANSYLATNIGGATYKDLFVVGNQFLAVGNDKTVKFSGQLSETATLKLIGQVVKV